jgi:tetratricopeptide (TPR) repeat protein
LSRAHQVLTDYYAAAGDSSRYAEQFALWLQGAPNDPEAIANLGSQHAAKGQWEQALVEFAKATQLDPRSVPVIDIAGGTYVNARRYQEAEPYFDRRISVQPDQAEPYIGRAWLAVLQGDTLAARRFLQEGASVVGLPQVIFQISRNSSSIRLLRIFPDYSAAVRGLSLASFGTDTVDYLIAKAMVYPDRSAMARAYHDSLRVAIKNWLRADPSPSGPNLALYMILAWADAGLGRTDAAIRGAEDLERGRGKFDPVQAGIIAEVYQLAGEPEAAIKRLEIALSHAWVNSPALLRLDPFWAPLRNDPKFQALLNQPEWRTNISR